MSHLFIFVSVKVQQSFFVQTWTFNIRRQDLSGAKLNLKNYKVTSVNFYSNLINCRNSITSHMCIVTVCNTYSRFLQKNQIWPDSVLNSLKVTTLNARWISTLKSQYDNKGLGVQINMLKAFTILYFKKRSRGNFWAFVIVFEWFQCIL